MLNLNYTSSLEICRNNRSYLKKSSDIEPELLDNRPTRLAECRQKPIYRITQQNRRSYPNTLTPRDLLSELSGMRTGGRPETWNNLELVLCLSTLVFGRARLRRANKLSKFRKTLYSRRHRLLLSFCLVLVVRGGRRSGDRPAHGILGCDLWLAATNLLG